ncbi:MAG: hypothetical protein IPI87_03905 [Betaproteobacteria bacterium]|nr:hypothetical protein [Betaproteobacteria bacterium]
MTTLSQKNPVASPSRLPSRSPSQVVLPKARSLQNQGTAGALGGAARAR